MSFSLGKNRDLKLKRKKRMRGLKEDVAAGGGLVADEEGASLTCRQAPRCLLVSHCHLCQQTTSCIQPSALINALALALHMLTANLSRAVWGRGVLA